MSAATVADMGMIAGYTLLDDDLFAQLIADPETASEAINDASGDDDIEDLDKFWDALHVALTGVTSLDSVDGDPLSEAIMGVREVDPDSDSEFVAVISRSDVPRILAALREVDIADIVGRLNPSAEVRGATYPSGIWDFDDLGAELAQVFRLLLAFYERAAASGRHIAVSFG